MSEIIDKKIQQIIKTHETTDIFKLIDFLGIILIYSDLGENTWGISNVTRRIKSIIISPHLTHPQQLFVLAHELGHCLLHTGISTPVFGRVAPRTSFIPQIEREASEFAIKLLLLGIDDDLRVHMTKYQILDYFELPYEFERFI